MNDEVCWEQVENFRIRKMGGKKFKIMKKFL